MTDNEINIAIAEACGWRPCDPNKAHRDQPDPEHLFCLPDGIGAPNYCRDLNAMHEAEGSIVEPYDIEEYVQQLYMVLERFWTPDRWVQFSGLAIDYAFAHATARQRAEAFLRTIGKWKE